MMNFKWKTARALARILALTVPLSLHAYEDQQMIAARAMARVSEVIDCEVAQGSSALFDKMVVKTKPEKLNYNDEIALKRIGFYSCNGRI